MTKEWPILTGGKLRFYDDGRKHPTFVDILEWDEEDLAYECGVRYMNVIDIDCFENHRKLRGKYRNIEVDSTYFKDYLNYIWNVNP